MLGAVKRSKKVSKPRRPKIPIITAVPNEATSDL